jgi:hypothetical protein
MALSGKFVALAAAALMSLPAAAWAETAAVTTAPPKKICIDPHYSYQAHYLSGHDIIAKATLGSDHRELKLSTTCLFLTSVYMISLHTDFNCIDKGDDVFTSTIDGEHQHCRITHVEPYIPAHPEPQG